MAFLHCHNCGWEQDDFWSENYHPLSCPMDWKDLLLYSKDIDKQFADDAEFVEENGPITIREVIARDLEKNAKRVRNMKFRTFKEFQEAGGNNLPCPNCGVVGELDID
ncbi:MAG: hypothetical protein K9H48_07740 [Melioribacteraceae bacterium]|nr:hypothetical protein [Melioribacteraceae bacterium]